MKTKQYALQDKDLSVYSNGAVTPFFSILQARKMLIASWSKFGSEKSLVAPHCQKILSQDGQGEAELGKYRFQRSAYQAMRKISRELMAGYKGVLDPTFEDNFYTTSTKSGTVCPPNATFSLQSKQQNIKVGVCN